MKWPSPPSTTQIPLGGGNLQQIIKFTHIFQPRVTQWVPTLFFPKRHISHYNRFLHHQGHDPKRRFRNVKSNHQRGISGPSLRRRITSRHTPVVTGTPTVSGFRRRLEVQVLQHQQPLGGPQSLEGNRGVDSGHPRTLTGGTLEKSVG